MMHDAPAALVRVARGLGGARVLSGSRSRRPVGLRAVAGGHSHDLGLSGGDGVAADDPGGLKYDHHGHLDAHEHGVVGDAVHGFGPLEELAGHDQCEAVEMAERVRSGGAKPSPAVASGTSRSS